jgi:peptidoglycan/LPS O-acetylase OafA/YrhL
LVGEYGATGGINLQSFYIRRVFRIVPPYIAALAGFVLLSALAEIPIKRWEILSCLLFFRNYEPLVGPTGPLHSSFLVASRRGSISIYFGRCF